MDSMLQTKRITILLELTVCKLVYRLKAEDCRRLETTLKHMVRTDRLCYQGTRAGALLVAAATYFLYQRSYDLNEPIV